MRFGVDFGTTRTVVAAVDRGNYPVVPVTDAAGDSHDYCPSVLALDADGSLLSGWAAVQSGSEHIARSFKRLLGAPDATGATQVRLGRENRRLDEVLHAYAASVVDNLRAYQRQEGTVGAHEETADEPPEIMLGVPAHAGSAQRLLTMSAFADAGARVMGLINEPSAAAFEYTRRHGTTLNSKRHSVIIYDLGGGTLDATLLHIDGRRHRVERSVGVNRLGGDDFDEVLLALALEEIGWSAEALGDRTRARLLSEARSAKEQIKPQSRRVLLDLDLPDEPGGPESGKATVAVVDIDKFYARAAGLVERSLEVLSPLVATEHDLVDRAVAGLYLVGGGTALPLIPRILRQRYGRRVHRSPLPTASTAVGLAIAADSGSGYQLTETLARGIGVFRDMDAGREVSFDPLVEPGSAADPDGFIRVSRTYRAGHNIGWFRYVEYSGLIGTGVVPGDLSVVTEVVVPFDPQLRGMSAAQLRRQPVRRLNVDPADAPLVREEVEVDPDGLATVRISVDGAQPVIASVR